MLIFVSSSRFLRLFNDHRTPSARLVECELDKSKIEEELKERQRKSEVSLLKKQSTAIRQEIAALHVFFLGSDEFVDCEFEKLRECQGRTDEIKRSLVMCMSRIIAGSANLDILLQEVVDVLPLFANSEVRSPIEDEFMAVHSLPAFEKALLSIILDWSQYARKEISWACSR